MHTLKKEIIFEFADMVFQNNDFTNIIFVTSTGLISGIPVAYTGEDKEHSDYFDDIAKLNHKISSEFKKKNSIPEGEFLDGNDGVLLLKDVTIKSGSATFNLPFLQLFFDQILGVTLGNFD